MLCSSNTRTKQHTNIRNLDGNIYRTISVAEAGSIPLVQTYGYCRPLKRLIWMRRCTIRAPDGLIEIHDGAGHQSGFFRGQESYRTCNFGRIDQPSERLAPGRFIEPVRRRIVKFALDAILAVRCHPANIQAIDANAVAKHRIGHVAGQRVERPLGGTVSRNEWLAAHGGHRRNIDDGSLNLVASEQLYRFLNEEERRSHIHRKQTVEQFGVGIQNGAPIRETSSVYEDIESSKHTISFRDDLAAVFHLLKIGLNENGFCSRFFQLIDLCPPLLSRTPAYQETFRASFSKQFGRCCSQPLGASRYDSNFTAELSVHSTLRKPIKPCRPVRQSDRQAPAHPPSGFAVRPCPHRSWFAFQALRRA